MKIMVTVAGYGGAGSPPITLAATLDDATAVMTVLKEIKYRDKPDKGYAFVTNLKLEAYDCLFTEEHLQGAILSYRESQGLGSFVMHDDMMRHRPRIETDGIDPKGQKYRLPGDINNGEIAVLALAYFQSRQRSVGAVSGQMERITHMYDFLSI